MADGPTSPERPLRPRMLGALQGLFRKGPQNPSQPQTDELEQSAPVNTEQVTTEKGKFGEVMTQLEKRNQTLGGWLVNKFGEGESRFMVLYNPLNKQDAQSATEDFLVISNQGFSILRVIIGTRKPDPQFPQYDTVTHRDNEGYLAENIIWKLSDRGSSRKRPPVWWAQPEGGTEGSGYTRDGLRHTLNFGNDHSLVFSTNFDRDDVAYYHEPTTAIKQLAVNDSVTQGRSKEMLNNIQVHSRIRLILNPDQKEVSEILKHNLEAAKVQFEREQQKEEEQAKTPAKDGSEITTAEVNPDTLAARRIQQDQTASDALEILKET